MARHAGATEVRVSLFNALDTLTLTTTTTEGGSRRNRLMTPSPLVNGMKERALFLQRRLRRLTPMRKTEDRSHHAYPRFGNDKGHDKSTG